MIKPRTLLLALGANQASAVGSPLATLKQALAELDRADLTVEAVAAWRVSSAIPPGAGPDFVNGAARLATTLCAEDALARLHAVERALGRTRRVRWGPRCCDLDLIADGDRVAPDAAQVRRLMALGPAVRAVPAPSGLILPHPRLHERAFVLVPLAEIAPNWRHPLTGATARQMLRALPAAAQGQVRLL